MFTYPVKKEDYYIGLSYGAPYGSRLNRLLGPRHAGVDFIPKANANLSARSVGAGMVRYAAMTRGSCGGRVDIDLGGGNVVRYCHLDEIKVRTGQKVKLDQIVGKVGGTGFSYPPGYVHLHFVWFVNGQTVDPMPYISNTREEVVRQLFQAIWMRKPALGDWRYFLVRWNDEGWDRNKLINTMKYWHSVVYKGGTLNEAGDAKWQRAKNKVL